MFLHNLLNVLVQIANTVRFKQIISYIVFKRVISRITSATHKFNSANNMLVLAFYNTLETRIFDLSCKNNQN
jgi:hypothetical protein